VDCGFIGLVAFCALMRMSICHSCAVRASHFFNAKKVTKNGVLVVLARLDAGFARVWQSSFVLVSAARKRFL